MEDAEVRVEAIDDTVKLYISYSALESRNGPQEGILHA